MGALLSIFNFQALLRLSPIRRFFTRCLQYKLPFSSTLAHYIRQYSHWLHRRSPFRNSDRGNQCSNPNCTGKVNLVRCTACHATYYCSQVCAAANWAHHRTRCKWFKRYNKRFRKFRRELFPNGTFHEIIIEACELKIQFPPFRKRIMSKRMCKVLEIEFQADIRAVDNLPEAVFHALVLPCKVTRDRIRELMWGGWTLDMEAEDSYEQSLYIGNPAIAVILTFRQIAPKSTAFVFDLDLKIRTKVLEVIVEEFSQATCALIAAYASHIILEGETDEIAIEQITDGLGLSDEFVNQHRSISFPESKSLIREES